MARIAGVDLPRKKRTEIGLTYIYGIGRTRSKSSCTRPASTRTRGSGSHRRRGPQDPRVLEEEGASKAICARRSR